MNGVIPSRKAFERIRRVIRTVEGTPVSGGQGARGAGAVWSVGDIAIANIGNRGIPQYGLFWKAEYRGDSNDYGVLIPDAAGLRSIGIATDHIPARRSGQGYTDGDRLVLWYERSTVYSPTMRPGLRMGSVAGEPVAAYDPFGPLRCLQIVTYPKTGTPGLALVSFEGGQ